MGEREIEREMGEREIEGKKNGDIFWKKKNSCQKKKKIRDVSQPTQKEGRGGKKKNRWEEQFTRRNDDFSIRNTVSFVLLINP